MKIDEFLLGEIIKYLPKGSLALDLGGGKGIYAKFCAERGLAVDIVDKELPGVTTPGMHFFEADLRNWVASNKKYHLIIVRSVLHYLNLNEVARLLAQLPAALADNGFLYITSLTPAGDSRFLHNPEFIKAHIAPLKHFFCMNIHNRLKGKLITFGI